MNLQEVMGVINEHKYFLRRVQPFEIKREL